MERIPFTVSELTAYIKQLVDSDMLLSCLGFRRNLEFQSPFIRAHVFFLLKDDKALIKCVMFRTQNSRLKFRPEEGMKVIARGYVSVYPWRNLSALHRWNAARWHRGALYLAFGAAKKKLEQQAILMLQEKPLPLLPCAIGVVTSSTGAVIRDIINVLTRRYFRIAELLYALALAAQGAEAPA